MRVVVDAAASVFRLQGDAVDMLQVAAKNSAFPPPRDPRPTEVVVRSTQVLIGHLPLPHVPLSPPLSHTHEQTTAPAQAPKELLFHFKIGFSVA